MRLLVTLLLATALHGASLTITSVCTSRGITVSSSGGACQLSPVRTSFFEDHRIGDGSDGNVLSVSLGASAEGIPVLFAVSASIDADLSIDLVTNGPERQGVADVRTQGYTSLGLLHAGQSEFGGFDLSVNGNRPDQMGGYLSGPLPANPIPVTLGTTEGIVFAAHVNALYTGSQGTGANIYAEVRLFEADGITQVAFREADVPEPNTWCLLFGGVSAVGLRYSRKCRGYSSLS